MIILATDNGLWLDERKALDGINVLALAGDGRTLFCGTSEGLWRTTDNASTWDQVLEGKVSAVASQQDTLWAGADPTALFRSRDGGRSWSELTALKNLPSAPTWSFPPHPETSHVRWIAPDPNHNGRLFVAIEAGALVTSEDGGDTWRDRVEGSPKDTHTLALPAGKPDTLYSSAGDGFSDPGAGFQESHDGGQTWFRPDEGLSHHYLWGVATSPDGSLTLISAADGPMQAHRANVAESFVYRRVDRGRWEPVHGGKGALAPVLHYAAGHFYCASNRGLHRSSDGLHWMCLHDVDRGRPNALLVV